MPAQASITSGRITEPDEVGALFALLVSGRRVNIVGADIVITVR